MSRRGIYTYILCAIAVLLFSGCGTKESYKILSFFFDGVPNPEAVSGAKDSGKKKVVKAQVTERGSEHGPYASRNCDGCHEKDTNSLVLPVRQLCYKCHVLRLEKYRWVHGPVATGGCIICHNPHRSGHPYLLDASPGEICFRCHRKKDVMKNKAHSGITGMCTNCHDAHGSDKRYLLK